MIIDCHTHWGICWEEKYREDPTKWLSILDTHGINKAFLMGYANLFRIDSCRSGNDTVANVASKAPDRLFPLGTSWPQMGKECLKEVERCIWELGMRGLKFHPWLQGFSLADKFFSEMCRLAGNKNVPVFLHDGTPCYSLSEQICGLARRFPKTKIVLSHSGLLWNWRSALEAFRRPNVWVCLCGPHMRAIEILCQYMEPKRILWGTDFGMGFEDSIGYRLGMFRYAKIDEHLKEQILAENPLQLLGVL